MSNSDSPIRETDLTVPYTDAEEVVAAEIPRYASYILTLSQIELGFMFAKKQWIVFGGEPPNTHWSPVY